MRNIDTDIRCYHKKLGGHVHMRVFVNGGKSGDLCVREEEFSTFKESSRGWVFYDEDREEV